MTARRDDLFVSVAVPELSAGLGAAEIVRRIAGALAERFRYWEILIVVGPDAAQGLEPLLTGGGNIRLLTVRHGTPFYRRRVAVAAEAIGDVVLLVSLDEEPLLDLVAMIERAEARAGIVIGRRASASLLNPVLRALGRSAGFRADGRDMLTAAYPRPLLSQLLAHPDRQLALRFPPSDEGIPVEMQECRGAGGPSRSIRDVRRRLDLLFRLLISSAPRVLTLVALLSLLVTASAVAFAGYAVIVWLTFPSVEPGWFTTSIVLSGTAAFLGLAIFGLTIGMHHVMDAHAADTAADIIAERSEADLFGQVVHELNVEMEESKGPAPVEGRR